MDTENKNISIPFHWSGSVRAITIVTLIVLIGTGFYLETKIWPEGMLWLKYLLRTVISGTILIGLGYMPIRLKASKERITVSRLFGSLTIPVDEILEAGILQKTDISDSIRLFGSGGLFGFLGLFRNTSLGKYTMYATDLDHLLFIRTRNRKYVFSCSRSEELLEYIDLRLKQHNGAK